MEVRLSPDKEALLARLATERGRDADALAQEVISNYLNEEARFLDAVKAGEAAIERGDFLTHDEVGTRIERLIQS